MQTQHLQKTRSKKSRGITNGKYNLTLDSVKFPDYEFVRRDIEKRIGNRPDMPKGLTRGKWTKQAKKVLGERYLVKDDDGNIVEKPEELCWRVAWDIASAEARWGKSRRQVINIAKLFYNLLVSHKFLPNSPTLMNAGTGNQLQYSGCYVLPVEDSIDGIFDAIKYQALVHKSGGGTGFAFSRLRQRGSVVKTSSGIASGPISFMRIFDAATNEIKQGGKRRGANMGILRVDHPDILEFIHCKEDGGVTNFNISVAITDKFMKAYENDTDYDLIDPKSKEVVGQLSATKVFQEIAEGAWKTGDPGLVFIDRINSSRANPVPSLGPIESTNPCGEQPLYPFDSCNLGSVYLTYLVKTVGGKKQVDWNEMKKVTSLAIRFMDDVIELNPYPLEEVRKTTLGIRRIGLGVGGWADMLIELGIPYDSEEALELGSKVMKTIQKESVKVTQELAKERDPFPMWPASIYKNEKPRRNSTVTTIAPTGTTSIIAGASSGIEPLFAVAFLHIVKDKHLDRTLTFINPAFESLARERGFWNENIKEKVSENGVIRDIDEIPEDARSIFGTAHEIHHDWHIKMQTAFQQHTDNAVSKTINMHNGVSVDDIKKAYLMAWDEGCRGVTVFRDGCKDVQVLNLGVKEKEKKEQQEQVQQVWERPMKITGSTYKINTPIGTAFITVNKDENDNPVEVFINIGRAGSDVQAMAEALGRLISKSLKFGEKMTARDRAEVIVNQLRGIGGRRSVGFGPNRILSLPDAIAYALSVDLGFRVYDNGGAKNDDLRDTNGEVINRDISEELPTMEPASRGGNTKEGESKGNTYAHDANVIGDICPECGVGALVYQEGCSKCFSCGHSEC